MQNLLDFFQNVLAGGSVMHGYKFNQLSINIKITVTGPDENCKLCYSSAVDTLINCNSKMFKF